MIFSQISPLLLAIPLIQCMDSRLDISKLDAVSPYAHWNHPNARNSPSSKAIDNGGTDSQYDTFFNHLDALYPKQQPSIPQDSVQSRDSESLVDKSNLKSPGIAYSNVHPSQKQDYYQHASMKVNDNSRPPAPPRPPPPPYNQNTIRNIPMNQKLLYSGTTTYDNRDPAHIENHSHLRQSSQLSSKVLNDIHIYNSLIQRSKWSSDPNQQLTHAGYFLHKEPRLRGYEMNEEVPEPLSPLLESLNLKPIASQQLYHQQQEQKPSKRISKETVPSKIKSNNHATLELNEILPLNSYKHVLNSQKASRFITSRLLKPDSLYEEALTLLKAPKWRHYQKDSTLTDDVKQIESAIEFNLRHAEPLPTISEETRKKYIRSVHPGFAECMSSEELTELIDLINAKNKRQQDLNELGIPRAIEMISNLKFDEEIYKFVASVHHQFELPVRPIIFQSASKFLAQSLNIAVPNRLFWEQVATNKDRLIELDRFLNTAKDLKTVDAELEAGLNLFHLFKHTKNDKISRGILEKLKLKMINLQKH